MEVSRQSPRENGHLDSLDSSWSPRRRASSSSESLRGARMDVGDAREGGSVDSVGGRKRENRWWRLRRLRESPYSCHPEFLDGRMTSLSSYGFVFGSAESPSALRGGSLGTFFLDPTSFAGRRADGDARLNIRYVDDREFLFQRFPEPEPGRRVLSSRTRQFCILAFTREREAC